MISTEKHKKHADIARPDFGEYGRNELAILGAPCGLIQKLSDTVIRALESDWNVAYVDADHASGDKEPVAPFPGLSRVTDKIAYRQLETLADPDTYRRRMDLDGHDLIMINGNHFKGKEQVVIIHPKKKDSLQRKLDRLTNLSLVLLAEGADTPYDFLDEHMTADTPVIQLSETETIIEWFKARMMNTIPKLNGLVLAGGKSTRLGHDKTIIDYYGVPQWQYMAQQLQGHCENVYVSRRNDQVELGNDAFPVLEDAFTGLGPFGGILSAFQRHPNTAWLVVAADLPFATEALETLIAGRNPSNVATAFHNKTTGFPDPLNTIWEPRAYPILLNFLAQGYSCPRKVLINSAITQLDVTDDKWLLNVNTAADLEAALKLMG